MLVYRNGNPFRRFRDLASLLSFQVHADVAVLDRDIVKLVETGRSQFYDLIRRSSLSSSSRSTYSC
jgi:hypothetical protein